MNYFEFREDYWKSLLEFVDKVFKSKPSYFRKYKSAYFETPRVIDVPDPEEYPNFDSSLGGRFGVRIGSDFTYLESDGSGNFRFESHSGDEDFRE